MGCGGGHTEPEPAVPTINGQTASQTAAATSGTNDGTADICLSLAFVITPAMKPGVRTQAILPGTNNCRQGGRVDFLWHDNDNNLAVTVGDSIDYIYSNCSDDRIDISANGSLSLTITTILGIVNVPPWAIQGDVTFNPLDVTSFGRTSNWEGGFRLTYSRTGTAYSFDVEPAPLVILFPPPRRLPRRRRRRSRRRRRCRRR